MAETLLEQDHAHDFLDTMRHSAAHIMAEAVLSIFPEGKVGIGPTIDYGFYYDFDLPRPLTPEDLVAIETKMQAIVAQDAPFSREEVSKDEARRIFAQQPYKLEIIDVIPDEQVRVYRQSGFTDLCRGPHLESTGQVKAFKLLTIAGAYWRGDEKRPMLQRIYGAAYETSEEVERYLELLEEARQRDHRKLGAELGLFTVAEEVGSGLPLWLPKGATIRRILERWIVDLELASGYQHVYTPHIAKVELYHRSGHWEKFHEAMFPVMERDNEQFVLRPMNCPHHILIYKSGMHSYRELPIRIAELGTQYRYEKSGELSGLSRVRAMTLNDAHIFCRAEQVKDEFKAVVNLILEAYKQLGFTSYWHRLSLHDPNDPVKYHPDEEMWQFTEQVLREAMDELGLPYVEAPGEAAFYGPKLDVQVQTALGKDETISTIQIDNHLPHRFDLEYIGEDGKAHRPTIIHRGVLSTFERMVAYLIENYKGVFPLWLAPVQAVLIPIADRHLEYAQKVASQLRALGLRVQVDDRSERMNSKIRDAQLQKVPYMLIMGDREAADGALSVRLLSGEEIRGQKVGDFVAMALEAVSKRGEAG
ncbi:MAG: threonine--tRNA ligase [Dehalococcoidia bacterium]|nr:threonine--tRNA ligase [Dehalococcoidia bacterium]